MKGKRTMRNPKTVTVATLKKYLKTEKCEYLRGEIEKELRYRKVSAEMDELIEKLKSDGMLERYLRETGLDFI